jgi:formamidopyrimidine-DNA glycosylase
MPELPEVETTRRGIAPHITGQRIQEVRVRHRGLRWPVPDELESRLTGLSVVAVDRRGKYLLFPTDGGVTMILHLGMSGSLSLGPKGPAGPHDHLDWLFSGGVRLRLHDPRRFGAVLLTENDPVDHPLLRNLGPEPFDPMFTGDYLYPIAKARRVGVKQLLMDAKVVVGVGNIYANEALFLSGVRPTRPCHRISASRLLRLRDAVVEVLQSAIEQGGTTLRDFVREDGRPGYFTQRLRVYGRAGLPCLVCAEPIRQIRIGQRSTFFCPTCQT